jgi:HSP20 family molecular chaperone IbpA
MIWNTPSGRYWDSWGAPGRLRRELDQLLERRAGSPAAAAGEFPAVNVWTGEDKAVLTAEVADMDPKAIELTVVNETITIRGSRETEEVKESETYQRQERGSGRFVRSFSLPFAIEAGTPVRQEMKRVRRRASVSGGTGV